MQLSMHFWRRASRCFSSSNAASWFFLSATIALILASSSLRILGPVNLSRRSSMPCASSRAMLACWLLSSSALSWALVRNPFCFMSRDHSRLCPARSFSIWQVAMYWRMSWRSWGKIPSLYSRWLISATSRMVRI